MPSDAGHLVKQTKQIRPGREMPALHTPGRLLFVAISGVFAMPHTFESVASPAGWRVTGSGAPVVLLHSSLASKSQWTALAERLAPRFRVIAFDLHGYGDNPLPAPASTFTVDDEVRLVRARLDNLVEPSERFHLVGHSYGALVAMRFAQLRSSRVVSMSLYEPVAFRMLDDDDPDLLSVRRMAEDVSRLVAGGRNQAAAQAFADFWSGNGYYESLPLPTRYAIARRVAKVPLDFQAAMRWRAQASDLQDLAVPSQMLVGTKGPALTRRIGARLAVALGDCRLRSCDAGHMGPITDASSVNPWIEAFIDSRECDDAAEVGTRVAVARPETIETTMAGR
jgi:pimeloyl-ACP methyl ester carboxylesterase